MADEMQPGPPGYEEGPEGFPSMAGGDVPCGAPPPWGGGPTASAGKVLNAAVSCSKDFDDGGALKPEAEARLRSYAAEAVPDRIAQADIARAYVRAAREVGKGREGPHHFSIFAWSCTLRAFD
eukprot:TRINITY_DN5876_c0_g1_i3.p2 TRINITY_DN5876_c0_g1~~TRINITY_DN5876_c0_g1_i3.p2  ORF type:complete len:123 (+),score=33.47 TRINITY_DN5876_c0_g1_i3:55-423(+)